jgi:hypothetical protein
VRYLLHLKSYSLIEAKAKDATPANGRRQVLPLFLAFEPNLTRSFQSLHNAGQLIVIKNILRSLTRLFVAAFKRYSFGV